MGAGCCDSKPFGEPCGECAFDEHAPSSGSGVRARIAGSGAATADRHDLAWGQLVAKSDSGASDFWKGAFALEVAGVRASPSMRDWIDQTRWQLSLASVSLGSRYQDAGSALGALHGGLGQAAARVALWEPPEDGWGDNGGGTTIGDTPAGEEESPEYGEDGPVPGSGLSEEERKREKAKVEEYKKKYPFIGEPSGKPPGGSGNDPGGGGPVGGGGGKGGRPKVPPTGGSGGSSGCCVSKFAYPAGKVKKAIGQGTVKYGGVESRGVAAHFRTEIVYTPKDDDTSCECECCTFRQFITDDYRALKKGPGDKKKGRPSNWAGHQILKPPGFEAGEDCQWWAFDANTSDYRKIQGTARAPWSLPQGGTPRHLRLLFPLIGPRCYGRRVPFSKEEEEQNKRVGYKKHDEVITKCTYSAKDTPSELIPLGYYFAWRIRYLGVVYDKCNGWKIRRVRDLPINIFGYSGASAHGTGVLDTPEKK